MKTPRPARPRLPSHRAPVGRLSRWTAALAFTTLLAMPGCRAAPVGGDDDDDDDDDAPSFAVDCADLEPSQGLSEPCCPDYGVDACGAALFCAAFDGRSQPTCYPERSRADSTSCTGDLQCTSGSCNLDAELCRAMPYSSCSPSVGCAPDLEGSQYGCDSNEAPATCQRLGDGAAGSLCLEPSDCDSGSCVGQSCKADLGQACSSQEDCLQGMCVQCYASNVGCTNYNDESECLVQCGSDPFSPYFAAVCSP